MACSRGVNSTKLTEYPGKSGPAVPNVDGGIKVGTFGSVVISALSHKFRLRHQCVT